MQVQESWWQLACRKILGVWKCPALSGLLPTLFLINFMSLGQINLIWRTSSSYKVRINSVLLYSNMMTLKRDNVSLVYIVCNTDNIYNVWNTSLKVTNSIFLSLCHMALIHHLVLASLKWRCVLEWKCDIIFEASTLTHAQRRFSDFAFIRKKPQR